MERHEWMARRIADCLEANLHEQGFGDPWKPLRYPSGEHKGVHLEQRRGWSEITLTSEPRRSDQQGETFLVLVFRLPFPGR